MIARRKVPALLLLASVAALGCSELAGRLTEDKGADAGAVASSSAASASPVPTSTAAAASKADLDKAFAALDINDDEQLDGIEVKSCGCAAADANGDGEITKAEYLAAGLTGRIRPGGAPAPKPAPTLTAAPAPKPTPTEKDPPSPPQAGGVPPGLYKCAGSVGGVYMTTGRVVILDATRYATGTDGAGQGTYRFSPETGQIVFTSGPNADLATVSYARLVAPTRIQMKTGKNGRNRWDCKR